MPPENSYKLRIDTQILQSSVLLKTCFERQRQGNASIYPVARHLFDYKPVPEQYGRCKPMRKRHHKSYTVMKQSRAELARIRGDH